MCSLLFCKWEGGRERGGDRDGLGWEMKPLQMPRCWLVEAIDRLVLLG